MSIKHLNKQANPPLKQGQASTGTQNFSHQQMTLSEIAARLRLVHGHLQQMPNANGDISLKKQDLSHYLDDMSRALLAEHYDRRNWQEKLLLKIEQIEQLQHLQAEKQSAMDAVQLAKIEEIIYKAALKTKHDMHVAITAQNEHDNQSEQEFSENVAKPTNDKEEAANFHQQQKNEKGQFLALRHQIAYIQQRLNESDKKTDKSVIYQLAEGSTPKTISKMTKILHKVGVNNQKDKNIKGNKTWFLAINPVKLVATLLALVVIYSFYLQFTHLLNDLSLLRF